MRVGSRIENLERRVMLAADAAPAAFGGKLPNSAWAAIGRAVLAGPLAGDSSSPSMAHPQAAHVDSSGDVEIDLHVNGSTSAAVTSVQSLGARVEARDDADGIVEVWAPTALLTNIASLNSIASINLPDYARFRASSATSDGDSILMADKVRTQFAQYGIDGRGIKVGVISDGCDNRSQVGSDLSSVTVNPSMVGSGDEGTAMLEIVHDLAPKAQLYFSGTGTNVQMVSAINWLMSQGCNVIVDDVAFYQEPFFTDGPVALAAQNAVNQGVVYVTAAGNESTPNGEHGDFHYDHQFVDDGSGARPYHNFNPGGPVDDFMDFNVDPGGSIDVVLQWSDAFGASSNDYDLYLYSGDHTKVLKESEDTQNGTQDPFETVHFDNPSPTAPTPVAIRIQKFTGDSRELQMFVLGDAQPLEYATPAGAIVGTAAAPGVIAVGAVDAGEANHDAVDDFSSQGPTAIYTNFDSQTRTTRNSLAGVAIDDVETRVGQLGYFADPFKGTSAAAPDAAAIAALVRDANPSLSPASIKQIMMVTATDLTAYGVGYDAVSGAGLFNALGAVYRAFVPTQAPDMLASSDSGISSSDNLTKINTPTFTGTAPLGSYVALYVDGAFSSGVQLASNASAYNVSASALNDGPHSVTIRLAPGASSIAPNLSTASPALSISIDRTPPTFTPLGFDLLTGRAVLFQISEDVSSTFHSGTLTLINAKNPSEAERESEDIRITSSQGIFIARIPFSGAGDPLPADGNYSATLDTTNVVDAAGNPAVAPAPLNFFVLAGDANRDRTVNALDFGSLAAHFGRISAAFTDGDFNYDGRVNSADFVALSARFNTHLAPPTATTPSLPEAPADWAPPSVSGFSEQPVQWLPMRDDVL